MKSYTDTELRHIFQNPFNRDTWKAILLNLFHADKLRSTPEHFTDPADAEQGYYMGAIDTSDSYRIGLFYYKLSSGSVAHKKVGLRNLVRKFINPTWGEFEAAIVVFDDGKEWRLSFVCDIKEEATAPKRFTFAFGEPESHYRTAIERFQLLQSHQATFENIRNAFSVDALSDAFFDEYRELYADFVQFINGKRYIKSGSKWVEKDFGNPNPQYESTFDKDDKLVRDYVKKMFGRVVFLYFLQRKGWMAGNLNYMGDLFSNSDKKDNFLDGVLEPLFFEVLNTDISDRSEAAKSLPGYENIPYLNGGLFAQDDIDELDCKFPQEYFEKLFKFLDSYNFTIDENDTDDAEIGIDPEMLGRIFENLLEDNNDKGAFYTPKEIVSYMCCESLIAYLNKELPEIGVDRLRLLIEKLDCADLNESEKKAIRKKLYSVKICDPAIGSGAFPMGLVNLLSKLYVAMKRDTDTSKMKRHIMENNIYGVDIEKGAVDIARLRFWLAMIVEEIEPMPLPNLHFKIMQGNSLLESYNGIDLSDLTTTTRKIGSLFDSTDFDREDLAADLKRYYGTSNHTKRNKLFTDIIYNVRRQLNDKTVELPKDFDPSENSDFFLWHTWFADVFDNGGFDIVIGNPPYIQLQKATGRKAIDKKGREYDQKLGDLYVDAKFESFEKTGDIYCLFYELGYRMIKPGGHLCYITSNKWMRAGYGASMRKFFANHTNPLVLFDCGGIQIFENATVDTNILLYAKEKNSHSTLAVCGTKDNKNVLNNLSDFVRQNGRVCDFSSSDSWVILSPIELSIKRKIEAVGKPLKDWNINIYRGVLTGCNDAFIISEEKRNEILGNCQTDDERERTAELIRPILRGRDIKRYDYDWAGLYLIATFPSRNYDIELYPAVKNYLLSFGKERLEQTGKEYIVNGEKVKARKKTNNKWFETQDSISYWEDFAQPKVIWKRIGSSLRFSYDCNGCFGLDSTCFAIGENIEFICCVLNSAMGSYMLRNAPKTGTGDLLISVQAIEPIMLPIISDSENDIFVHLLESSHEQEINQRVLELYHLTPEEQIYILNK